MEIIDVVNEKDEVIGQASKEEIYDKLLTHRIVHILVFNEKGELALQLLSKNRRFCPSNWSTPVGGHVRSGESYEEAALREFNEELGTSAKIDFQYKDVYQAKKGFTKILVTFKAISNGPFSIDSREAQKVEFFSLARIGEMLRKGEKFHPELLFLLEKHLGISHPKRNSKQTAHKNRA